ncbi:MAG: hypothetical protein OER04_01715 [Cyclobacteriaceae bacterium]|nr:hypothetical protein [Cyclobacteriaceae bacterium]
MRTFLARWGLISRKMRWGITLRGLLSIMLTLGILITLTIFLLHPFLALNKPSPNAKLLIIDGPIPEYAVQAAVKEFHSGNYQLMIATGGPISRGYLVPDIKSYPQLVAASLIHQQFDSSKIVVVDRDAVITDRTYANAVSLKDWLQSSSGNYEAINIFSMGTHARRTRLLYQKALPKSVEVGVLATPNLEYDRSNWWRSSMGFRLVIGEGIAYIYARFLFRSGS